MIKKNHRCVLLFINLRCDYTHHLGKMSFANSAILYEFELKGCEKKLIICWKCKIEMNNIHVNNR